MAFWSHVRVTSGLRVGTAALAVLGTSAYNFRPCHAHSMNADAKWASAHEEKGHMMFAIPKKGRLYEKIVLMLKGSGFEYTRPSRLDIADCNDLPITFVFLPASDIATYVSEVLIPYPLLKLAFYVLCRACRKSERFHSWLNKCT